MKILHISSLLLLLTIGSACSRLNVYKTFGDNFRENQKFNGIKDITSNPDNKHLNILFIHGMGGYSNNDPEPLVESIKKQYPYLKQVGSVETNKLKHEGRVVGVLSITKTESKSRDRSITYSVLDWGAVTYDIKNVIKCNDKDIHYDTTDRLSVTKAIRSFINHNIGDVALYAGDYKTAMQIPVRLAIKHIGGKHNNIPNIVITFSLGSTMLFDTLYKMTEEKGRAKLAANALKNNNKLLIMLSNQIPIIHLSEITAKKITKNKGKQNLQITSSIKAIGSFVNAIKKSNNAARSLPQIIAISDPNDILSYPIFENMKRLHPNTFITVLTSVSRKGYWLPKLGRFTHYGKAHSNYGTDKKVLDIIMKGSGASR